MTLGVFLSSGESRDSFQRIGQLSRLDAYLKTYANHLQKIYLFAYDQSLVHRYIWMFLMPFFRWQELRSCNVYRVLQFPGVLPAVIAKWLFQKPILATYGYPYAEFFRIESSRFHLGFLWILEKVCFPFINRFLVTSEAMKRYLEKKNIARDRIIVIPNGVDTRLFFPIKRTRQKEKTTILFVGRFERQKNLFALIEAVSLLENRDGIRLRLVGDGSLKNDLLERAKSSNLNIDIRPFMQHDKLPSVYQQADLFILPSLQEGQPKVLLEAMSCGLPCIVARFPGVEEIVHHGKNGLIVSSTAEEISRSIKKLQHDRSLAVDIGRNARETIVRSFDLRKLLSREVKILEELAR